MEELVKRLRDAAKMSEALAVLLPHSEGNATAKLYNEAADAIGELSKPRWISVEERLPETDCHVLAYYGFDRGDGYLGMMFTGVLDYYAYDPQPHFQHESTGLRVTHWMPLPELPKEE